MYDDKALQELIATVEEQFTAHLSLAKSEDEKSKEKEEPKEGSEKKMETESKEDKGVEDQHQQESPKEEGEKPESKEESNEDPKEAPSEEAHGDVESHNYDDEDMAHMHAMYSSMSKAEMRAHHDCIRKAMDSCGLAKCEDGMAKSEKDVVVDVAQVQEVSLLKSELEAAKAQSEERKKNLEAVEAFLTKFVERTAPAGKAITSLDIIAKTENGSAAEKPLQKSEIDSKLLNKAKDPSLSKSDREAINSYYCGSKNIEKVSHLLK